MEREVDPIKMYIVVRRSLKLSAGKVGGQCGHAVHYFMRAFWEASKDPATMRTDALYARLMLAVRWDESPDHTKVILGATDEEFEQLKVENPEHFLVVDLGRTQVAPNTQTCLGLWPMKVSERSPLLTKLKPL